MYIYTYIYVCIYILYIYKYIYIYIYLKWTCINGAMNLSVVIMNSIND